MEMLSQSVGATERSTVEVDGESLPQRTRKWFLSYRSIEPVAIAFDAMAILAASILSEILYHRVTIGSNGDVLQFAGMAAPVLALFVVIAKSRDLYKPISLLSIKSQVRSIVLAWFGTFLFFAGIVFALKIGQDISRGVTLSFAGTGIVGLCALRIFWRLTIERGLENSKFFGRRAALLTGPTSFAERNLRRLLSRHGFQIHRHFVIPIHMRDLQGCKKIVREVIAYVRGSEIEEIIVGADLNHWIELDPIFAELRAVPLPVNFIPICPASKIFSMPSHMIGNKICIELHRGPLSSIERVAKRVVDIVFAMAGLVLLLPFMLMVAIAIKSDSPGPTLFRQRRCGFNGKQFRILKFRTMTVTEDDSAITQATRQDKRVTHVGRWLRRTSIDELPQLFNVLYGSMSIVGPRPHAILHDSQFQKIVANYSLRHHVKPGLTGWAQVNGFRGETPTADDMERRVKLDLWYIENWSLMLDFQIVFRTIAEILRGKNAY